jgi:hypothetical protein
MPLPENMIFLLEIMIMRDEHRHPGKATKIRKRSPEIHSGKYLFTPAKASELTTTKRRQDAQALQSTI